MSIRIQRQAFSFCLLAVLALPRLGLAQAPTATPVPTPNCSANDLPPCMEPASYSSNPTITCADLNAGYTFTAGSDVMVEGDSVSGGGALKKCDMNQGIIISAAGVRLRPVKDSLQLNFIDTVGSCKDGQGGIKVNASNVVIENIRVTCIEDNPTSPKGSGIWIVDGKSNVTLKNVYLNGNQYGLRSAGDNVCVIDSEANWNEDNGFWITSAAGGRYAFRNTKAMNNRWGFFMDPGTGVTDAQFLLVSAEFNFREGMVLAGNYAEVLCSNVSSTVPLSDENKARSGDGHGIVTSATRLQVENTLVAANWRQGVLINSGWTNIVGSTVADNDGGRLTLTPGPTPTGTPLTGAQIRKLGGTSRVFNTVTRGTLMISSAAGPTPICGYSVYTDAPGHANCTASVPSGIVQGSPSFVGNYELGRGSVGLDVGTNVAPAALPTLAARVAHKEAKDGSTRPLDSNQDGSAVNDMGAYERLDPQATTTRTRTSTRTPTKTPVANTPTPTRTPTGCPLDCLGDCNCNGAVAVNELIGGVAMVLGEQSLNSNCFDCSEDGSLSINELIQAVGNAMEGCPTVQPEPCGNGGGMMLLSVGGPGGAVSVTSATAHRNDTIEFSIYAEDADELIAGISLDLGFATNVLSIPECVSNPQLPGGFQISASSPSAGVRRLILVDIGEFPLPRMSDGRIATCTAKVLPAAPFATHTLSVSRIQLSNAFGMPLDGYGVDGTVTVN